MSDETIPTRCSLPWRNRFKAFLAGAFCLALLIGGNRLKPDPAGIGTHTQLHLPACGLYERTGYPCPTCGVTTAFCLGAQGHVWQALKTQPLGAVLSILCWVSLGASVLGVFWPVFMGTLHQKLVTIHFRLDSRFSSINGIWWFYGLAAAGVVLVSWLVVCLRVRF